MASSSSKPTPRPVQLGLLLLTLGLLMTTLSLTLAPKLHWSDATRGTVIGIGLGLEIIAMVLFLRNLRAGGTKSR